MMLTRRLVLGSMAALSLPRLGFAADREVTDMAGRKVKLPAKIERTVTLGSLPVINSFVYSMAEGGTIVNGLADFARAHWKYQTVFAPNVASKPTMQQPNREPNVEAIMHAKPDVVLTMHREHVETLASRGVPVVFLSWQQPEEVKECMRVLGEVFGKPERSARYQRYFDDTMARVSAAIAPVAAARRPTVLYFQPSNLTQPRLIAEWWIPAAGGVSVTDDGRQTESKTFSLEQLVKWDPDILIVTEPKDVELVKKDRVFSQLKAVKSGKVHVVPVGAHTWSNRTAEQPLTVLWAVETFHPGRLKDLNLAAETRRFYREFFDHELPDAAVTEILSGTL
ncbi:MAG: ABC transporter substrate-binding protein [Alphaproteobacteria bacterium]|nr:ABC transporter substrate-binding protein [Alphaproteobacteria bacterium]